MFWIGLTKGIINKGDNAAELKLYKIWNEPLSIL